MRICYIANASSLHTQRWVKYFADIGYETHVISPLLLGNGDIGRAKLHILKRTPVQIRAVSFPINLLSNDIQIRELIRKIKPDIVHAHYITDCGFWAALSGFHPLVLSAWGSDILVDPKRSPILKRIIKYALSKADLVICDSETLRKGAIELGTSATKVRIVYDGIDTQTFSPRKRNQNLKSKLGVSGAPTIISTRKLEPVYNVEMLIKAIPLVLKQVSEARFIIVGDGEQTEYLKGLADSLGASSSVRFLGLIPHDELPEYLASSDIYISTSLSDSTSLSLQEAMACELAPVVTDLPANREWVTDGESGFIVPVGDHEMLADKILYLLTNKETRDKFGKTGRILIASRAEHQKEMARMGKIYENLAENKMADGRSELNANTSSPDTLSRAG